MMDWFLGLKAKLIAGLIAIVGLVASYFYMREKFKEDGRKQVATEESEKALDRVLKAEDIGAEVDKMTEDKVNAELKKWMRPDSDTKP